MTPLFANDEYWEKFYREIVSWSGTPRRHMQRTKGRGTDCTAYIGESLVFAGVLSKLDTIDYYPKDWALVPGLENMIVNQTDLNFKNNLRGGFGYISIYHNSEQDFSHVRGDICLFNLRRDTGAINHTGVLVSESEMIHLSSKVRMTPYNNTWKAIQAVTFRIMET